MSVAILVAIICCCFCTEVIGADQIVQASEYDDFLKIQQDRMQQEFCKSLDKKRTPIQTLYKLYPADCEVSHIPIRLLILQTIRRERKFGVLDQPDIDELHQEILHYLLLKNGQLLNHLFSRLHIINARDVQDIRTFHKYLFEYYGELFLHELYKTSIDTHLSFFDGNILVDYMYIIYRRNTEDTFKIMVLALLHLVGKLPKDGERHLRDMLYEISQSELYYQLSDEVKQRVEQNIDGKKSPITNVKYLLDAIGSKFQNATIVDGIENVQHIYADLIKRILSSFYSETDLNRQLSGDIKQRIDQFIDTNTPNYNVEDWENLILLKWRGALIVESMEFITNTYRQLLGTYPIAFVRDVFMRLIRQVPANYNNKPHIPVWLPKYLHMIYQPGNLESYKLMVAIQMQSLKIHTDTEFRTTLYDLHIGYYLRKITKDNYQRQLDDDVKHQLVDVIKTLPTPIKKLYFYDSFCLKNKAHNVVLSDKGKKFIPAFYNNENNRISLELDQTKTSLFKIEMTLQSSSGPEYLNENHFYNEKFLPMKETKTFWTVELVVEYLNFKHNTYKALQFHHKGYYVCCFDNPYETNKTALCYMNISLYPDKYNTENCWWSVETGSKCKIK